MKKGIVVLVALAHGFMVMPHLYNDTGDTKMISEQIQSIESVKALFPKTPHEIDEQVARCLEQAKKDLEAILVIPTEKRTFENTVQALDNLVARSDLVVKEAVFAVIEYLHPNEEMRNAAHGAVLAIKNFFVDEVSGNKKLYQSFKEYVEHNAHQEQLNKEQQYYLQEEMKDFKRAGLDLPDEKLEQVKQITKEIAQCAQEFDRNIAQDQSTIAVCYDDLRGLDEHFIASLKKNDEGLYILGVDYPTYFQVMEHGEVEATRKKLYETFSNRAYPINEPLLQRIIALRDQLATLLQFSSFAALNLDSQMAKTPERVQQFLDDLIVRARQKTEQELDLFTKELPESVTLAADGKIKAWDLPYLKTKYKEKHFKIDERKIAEYFPMQHTIDSLLAIYQQFMSLTFREMPISGMWHENVRFIEVYDKAGGVLFGYLLLDLHPRPNKYSHAAHIGLVPALCLADGRRLPDVSVVMANFPKPTHDKPSLLMRSDVRTFFHEFGHAVHALLGATHMGSFSGTSVKTDFVELPSQMLEEWLWDKDIIKKVSSHYQTGEPLPDDIIDNIIQLKRYDSGIFVQTQSVYSQLSLDMYKSGAHKDPYMLLHTLLSRLSPRIFYGPSYRMYTSFGHLTGYGAKYYGYLWSKVFALDLFEEIKKHGLLNPEVGTRYVHEVIGKGGSKDPNELLKQFLGREPRQDAFIKDLGL